jgi:hypothetical protein
MACDGAYKQACVPYGKVVGESNSPTAASLDAWNHRLAEWEVSWLGGLPFAPPG